MKPPIIPLDQPITIADWRKGRAERRRVGLLVAPATIRRAEGSSDPRLRAAFGGERAPLHRPAAGPAPAPVPPHRCV